MIEEVMNGYSIAFSAAIGRKASPWMEEGTEYRKVDNAEELYEITYAYDQTGLVDDEAKVALVC
jgi:hypothetical protein